jgi:hypothetical protein
MFDTIEFEITGLHESNRMMYAAHNATEAKYRHSEVKQLLDADEKITAIRYYKCVSVDTPVGCPV